MREVLEWSTQGIELLAVIIILVSILLGLVRFLLQLPTHAADPYRAYKVLLGRSLLLALEFMVAADVIRTVLLDLTARSLEILAGLVVIRTFLSWAVVVELDGHWPWQSAALAASTGRLGGEDAEHPVFRSVGRADQPDRGPFEVPVRAAALDGDIAGDPRRA